MCRWPLRAPTPLQSIMWPIIDPILVTFGQIYNFQTPNLVTFYFYELTHFLDGMKNTFLFVYSTNILVHLLTVNMKNCLIPKNQKMCDRILVNPVVKMRPHPATYPHQPVIRKYRPPPGPDSRPKRAKSIPVFRPIRCKNRTRWGGTYLYGLYKGVPPPSPAPPPPNPAATTVADYPYFLSTGMQTTIHPLTLDNNIIFQDVFKFCISIRQIFVEFQQP